MLSTCSWSHDTHGLRDAKLECPGGNCSLELRLRQQSRKTSLLRDEAGIAAGVELADEVAEPVVQQEARRCVPVVDHEHAEILECVFEFTRRSTSSSGETEQG
jgi:hypothetical protein